MVRNRQRVQEDGWWAHKGSNLGPLPCEGNALPLSYASGIICRRPDFRPAGHRSPRFTKCGPMVSSFQAPRVGNLTMAQFAAKPWFGPLTRPAGGRGRRGTAARGCARRACRRPRAGWRPRRCRRRHWPGAAPVSAAGRFGGQHGLDRRIRSLELHRELCDLGGDVVDALAQQRIFHALGRPGAFGLLLDRVDVALQLGALVARDAELLLDRGLFGAQLFDRRRRFAAARQRRDLVAQFLDGALGGLVGLAQLVVLVFALGQQLALRRRAGLRDR